MWQDNWYFSQRGRRTHHLITEIKTADEKDAWSSILPHYTIASGPTCISIVYTCFGFIEYPYCSDCEVWYTIVRVLLKNEWRSTRRVASYRCVNRAGARRGATVWAPVASGTVRDVCKTRLTIFKHRTRYLDCSCVSATN